jgi:hypothetical protein
LVRKQKEAIIVANVEETIAEIAVEEMTVVVAVAAVIAENVAVDSSFNNEYRYRRISNAIHRKIETRHHVTTKKIEAQEGAKGPDT